MSADFLGLTSEGIRDLEPYKPGKPIADLEREYGVSDVIKLASNENPAGPGAKVLEAIEDALGDISRYPDGSGLELKAAIAERHRVLNDRVTLGNGSNDLLEFVARAFLRPGTECLFSQHAFAVYPIVAKAAGADIKLAPVIAEDQPGAYGHDLEAMALLVSEKTRVIFIANPNNPTGTYIDAKALKGFIEQLPQDLIVVIDEAYSEYVEARDYPDTSQWIDDHPNLVVTRTFSKAFGMAGMRVGYGLSDPAVADILNRVRQPFNLNSLGQVAAIAALEDRAHLKRAVESNSQGLKYLCQSFTEMGLNFIPSVANFVCVNVGCAGKSVYEGLLRHGIIVRPVDNYQLPRFIRVTVGLTEENQRFVAALREVLEEIKSS